MELGKLKQNPSHGGHQNFGRGVEDDQNLAFISVTPQTRPRRYDRIRCATLMRSKRSVLLSLENLVGVVKDTF